MRKNQADRCLILLRQGYILSFKSENVARYQSPEVAYGMIDIIFAFREVSRKMLSRSVIVSLGDDLSARSVVPEDIIGLKVQAIANDPDRFDLDFADIRALLAVKAKAGERIEWDLLDDYFTLFDRQDLLDGLRGEYGEA